MHVRMRGEEYDLAGLRNACEHSERRFSAPVVEVEPPNVKPSKARQLSLRKAGGFEAAASRVLGQNDVFRVVLLSGGAARSAS
jgi:hypothetical protein